jgi:hypothetical protein
VGADPEPGEGLDPDDVGADTNGPASKVKIITKILIFII